MNTGRIFLLGFVVLVTVIALASIQDFVIEETPSVEIEESSTQAGTISVEISDGVGSDDKG